MSFLQQSRVLFLAAEAAPFIKVGGLADVVGSLPSVLSAQDLDVRIMMPFYGKLESAGIKGERVFGPTSISFGGQDLSVSIFQTTLPPHNTIVYLVHIPDQFSGDAYVTGQSQEDLREGVRRFVLWSWVVAKLLPDFSWQPDILHVHDWHAAAIPVFHQIQHGHVPPSLLTIHNLSIQGKWNRDELLSWIGDDAVKVGAQLPDGAEANMLGWGIQTTTAVSTVSPTYAQEILTPTFGEGLESVLQSRGVVGIVNGIDQELFSPAHDPALAQTYTKETVQSAKERNKSALQAALGLAVNSEATLLSFIGRLTPQKGVDSLVDSAEDLLALGAQLVFLGTGQPDIATKVAALVQQHPQSVHHIDRFDAVLGQQLYAASDALVMPSRFEPCGLGQLIAMRYGTIPIVTNTGGLHDTVIDVRHEPQTGTGFVLPRLSSGDIVQAVQDMIALKKTPADYWALIERSMDHDSSWYTSAQQYAALYASLSRKK